jgi:hypothetical protein
MIKAVYRNAENVRKLEAACTKHYRFSSLPLGNKNDGGGGALGLRTNDRDVNGKRIYLEDPEGYFLYMLMENESTWKTQKDISCT